MTDIIRYKENELDFFKELENIGVSHAATALSVMLDRKVDICVPRAQFCGYNEICEILRGPENIVTALLVSIFGSIEGFIMLVLDKEEAKKLTQLLVGDLETAPNGDDFGELQISALKEVSNILISSYITAISSLTGFRIDSSVPDLVIDMAGAVMNLLTAAYGEYSDTVLFLETEFLDEDSSVMGHFFLIPDAASYQKLIEKMEVN